MLLEHDYGISLLNIIDFTNVDKKQNQDIFSTFFDIEEEINPFLLDIEEGTGYSFAESTGKKSTYRGNFYINYIYYKSIPVDIDELDDAYVSVTACTVENSNASTFWGKDGFIGYWALHVGRRCGKNHVVNTPVDISNLTYMVLKDILVTVHLVSKNSKNISVVSTCVKSIPFPFFSLAYEDQESFKKKITRNLSKVLEEVRYAYAPNLIDPLAMYFFKNDPSNPQENLIDEVEDVFDVHVDSLADRLTTFFYHLNLKATYNDVKRLEENIKERIDVSLKREQTFCPQNKLDIGYYTKFNTENYKVARDNLVGSILEE